MAKKSLNSNLITAVLYILVGIVIEILLFAKVIKD